FLTFLQSLNIHSSKELVINAEGKNNLYHPSADFTFIERKVKGWIDTLIAKRVEVIFFLIDFDNSDKCFSHFKLKVYHLQNNRIVIAKQVLEAWYLADNNALSNYLLQKIIQINNPESFLFPFEEIKSLRQQYQNRGIADKKILTKDMIKSGFTLPNAAAHPQCFSAQYFLSKLSALKVSL
ncbi:MAG TPA: hypothetical protein VN958_12515, partial [Chitinophagaceae bacterium]|nr:hypothetical protein [Chitinophagaceae bacterium]